MKTAWMFKMSFKKQQQQQKCGYKNIMATFHFNIFQMVMLLLNVLNKW